MKILKPDEVHVPLDVPPEMREAFTRRVLHATFGTGMHMLYASDQRIEHLGKDHLRLADSKLPPENENPINQWRIAKQGVVGFIAAHWGLVTHYARDFPGVPILVKLNGKTNAIPTSEKDPFSMALVEVSQVVKLIETTNLPIIGVGMTVYAGSEFEDEMLRQVQQMVIEAHENGLLSYSWWYPRGFHVGLKEEGKPNPETDPLLIAGVTGVAASIGTDVAKINRPHATEKVTEEDALAAAVRNAGRTSVICAGGSCGDPRVFLRRLHTQIHTCGASGNATGRSVHQLPLSQAIRMTMAISSITVGDFDPDDAVAVYEGRRDFTPPVRPSLEA